MAPIRTSNVERSRWRSKCREELSKHINHRIGVLIEPSQVRLIPGPDDLYKWEFLPEGKHLFLKNISDHSISAYKELCGNIGVLFEAVPAKNTRIRIGNDETVQEADELPKPLELSFSAKINELQDENLKIEQELEQWRDKATKELELRYKLEHELHQLKDINQALQKESEKNIAAANYFRNDSQQQKEILNKIMELIDSLRCKT